MCRKVVVNNDIFNIAERVKAIDDGYYLVYDRALARYEVHNNKAHESLQLVLPYDRLDARSLYHIRKTIVADVAKLMHELDEHNERLNQSKIATSCDKISLKVKSLIEYEGRTGKSAPAYEAL